MSVTGKKKAQRRLLKEDQGFDFSDPTKRVFAPSLDKLDPLTKAGPHSRDPGTRPLSEPEVQYLQKVCVNMYKIRRRRRITI